MTGNEFVQRLVLNEVCDDYENIDQVILRAVAETGAKCGLTVDRTEVVAALTVLVQQGLVKAYDLRPYEPFGGKIDGMPPVDAVEEDFRTYFYATKDGIEVQGSDHAWWPLDDDGELRPDWRLGS